MDRPIAQIGEMIPEWMVTRPAQDFMLALGKALQATAGTSTFTVGLACTPNSPAALNVLVGEGEIYMMESLEASTMGTLPADTAHQVLKQGMNRGAVTLSTPAPTTAGQSINYLIQATYQDNDVSLDPTTGNTSIVMPFFSGTVGQTPWNGPNNSGQTSNTFRQGLCNVTVKAGASATTGTQTTPAPDSGYVGLYVVTVANGQASVTSGNISAYSGAPASVPTLQSLPGSIQNSGFCWGGAAGGTANALTATLTPAPSSLTTGLNVLVKASAANTAPATFNVNGLGAKSIVNIDGSALIANEITSGMVLDLLYDGTNFVLLNGNASAAAVANVQPALLASTGYQKLAGGFIMQWGCPSGPAAGASATFTFATTFPTACLSIVMMPLGTGIGSSAESISAQATTTGGTMYNNGAAVSFNGGVFYIAIGK